MIFGKAAFFGGKRGNFFYFWALGEVREERAWRAPRIDGVSASYCLL
jgi:hypothetical protein